MHKRDRIIESPSYRPGLPRPVAPGYENLGPSVHANGSIGTSNLSRPATTAHSTSPSSSLHQVHHNQHSLGGHSQQGHTFTNYTFAPNSNGATTMMASNSINSSSTGHNSGHSANDNNTSQHIMPPPAPSAHSNSTNNNDYILNSLDIGSNPLSTLASAAGSITAPVDSGGTLHILMGGGGGNGDGNSVTQNSSSHQQGIGIDASHNSSNKRPPLSKINSALPVAVPQLPQGHGYNALLINSHGLRLTNTQLNRYLTIYFTNFHWCLPILHLPSFDPLHQSSQILSAVCGIGAWLCGETKVAVELHNVSRNSAMSSFNESYNGHSHPSNHHGSMFGGMSSSTSQTSSYQQNNLVALQTAVLNLVFLVWCRADHRDAQSHIAHGIHCLNRVTTASPMFSSEGSEQHQYGGERGAFGAAKDTHGSWQLREAEKRALFGLFIVLTSLNSIYGFPTPLPANELLRLDVDLPCSERFWTEYHDLGGSPHTGNSGPGINTSLPSLPPSPDHTLPPLPLKFGFVLNKILSNEQVVAKLSSFALQIMGCALLLETSSGINPVLKSKVITGMIIFDEFYLKDGSSQSLSSRQQNQNQATSLYQFGSLPSTFCPSPPPASSMDTTHSEMLPPSPTASGIGFGGGISGGTMKTMYRILYISAQLRLCLNDPLYGLRDLLGSGTLSAMGLPNGGGIGGSSVSSSTPTTYQQHQQQQEINHMLYNILGMMSSGGHTRGYRVAGLVQDAFQIIFSVPTAMGLEMFRRTMASTPAVVASIPSIYFVSFELTVVIIAWIHIYETSSSLGMGNESHNNASNGNSNSASDVEDPDAGPVYRQIASSCIESGVAAESQCIAPAIADFASEILESIDLWWLSPIISTSLRQFGSTLRDAVSRKPVGAMS